MLDSTRVSPVTLSFSTVISTEYMAGTRGTGYTAAAAQVPPSGLQPSQGEEPAQNQAAGTSQVRPSPAQPPSVAPQCPGSRSGRLCSTLGPSLLFPPGLENLELSHLLRGASVQKGLPCPRSQPQLELG